MKLRSLLRSDLLEAVAGVAVKELGTAVRAFDFVRRLLHGRLGARNDMHAVAIGFRRGLLTVEGRGALAATANDLRGLAM